MTDTTQPVVEPTVAPAPQAGEAEGARKDPDLESLLAEFDQEVKTEPAKPPEPTPQPQPNEFQVAAKLQTIERTAAEWQRRIERQDIDSLVKRVRGDIDPETVDDQDVEDWLNGQAMRNPALANAWVNRQANPKQFAKIEQELQRQYAEKFERRASRKVDAGVTEDRIAVAAAVRGASSTKVAPAEPSPELGKLSNSQLRKHVMDNYGFDPGV